MPIVRGDRRRRLRGGEAPCLTPAASGGGLDGFVLDEAEVIYWGLCPDCVAAQLRKIRVTSVITAQFTTLGRNLVPEIGTRRRPRQQAAGRRRQQPGLVAKRGQPEDPAENPRGPPLGDGFDYREVDNLDFEAFNRLIS